MFVGGERRVGGEPAVAGEGVSSASLVGGGSSLPLVEGLGGDVSERLRLVFQGLLDGRGLDESAAAVGMSSSGVLALVVAHEGAADMFARVVRVLGFKSVVKVSELAVRAEGALGPVPGLRLALDAHKFLAVNGLPELLSRTSSSADRRGNYERQVERRERAEHGEVELVTGVREGGEV